MKQTDTLEQTEIINLLNKCWMTHDGMWFFHCLQEFGIETTNRLNKSAIKSLAPIETDRIRKMLGVEIPVRNFDEFKRFFDEASRLVIPDFMNVRFDYSGHNRMSWRFTEARCFAYTGIKRLGEIAGYECGVLYRIKCWLDVLGIKNRFHPEIDMCHQHHNGDCSGTIDLFTA